jgi:hypothetical protein
VFEFNGRHDCSLLLLVKSFVPVRLVPLEEDRASGAEEIWNDIDGSTFVMYPQVPTGTTVYLYPQQIATVVVL